MGARTKWGHQILTIVAQKGQSMSRSSVEGGVTILSDGRSNSMCCLSRTVSPASDHGERSATLSNIGNHSVRDGCGSEDVFRK